MEKTFWGTIWSIYWSEQGRIITVLGAILLPIVLWGLAPNTVVPLTWALPIGIVCIIIIVTLANAAYQIFTETKRLLPRVIYARKSYPPLEDAKALCLLEPSVLFSHNTLVSFYFVGDDEFELFMGIGLVVNIQEDGKIQVALLHVATGLQAEVQQLSQNDAAVLGKIRVKPNIPWGPLELEKI